MKDNRIIKCILAVVNFANATMRKLIFHLLSTLRIYLMNYKRHVYPSSPF